MRADLPELLAVCFREAFEDAISGRREREINFAPIARAARFFEVTVPNQPVDQPDGAVMENLQSRGEFAHGDAFGETFDRQQGLVLLRSNPGRRRRIFAEAREPAKSVAKLGQDFVFPLGNARFSSRHAGSMADGARAVDDK